jgi:hypothetical protein
MESDDVRRVVANWPEYGGFITRNERVNVIRIIIHLKKSG